ncbi:hypothetical protein DPMN_064301 [Dreissena polymorpha]|uniref:Uncharacterized protein n=1 Tax=Dreissena polymorpha TaxID=45954 RepID=A0A9D4CDC6_DREPO|nr:hypothetical protein DPMN_064301 [Dreissena polymorpha]
MTCTYRRHRANRDGSRTTINHANSRASARSSKTRDTGERVYKTLLERKRGQEGKFANQPGYV